MMYNNDETDKAVRTRNYYLYVWAIPVITAVSGIAFAFCNTDYFIVFFPVTIAAVLWHHWQSANWLKMPDGSYYNTRHLQKEKPNSINEPASYEVEYRTSLLNKLVLFLAAFGLAWFNLYQLPQYNGDYVWQEFIPLMIAAVFFIMGIMSIRDTEPHLKLARTGIWSKKMGFVTWKQVDTTKVVGQKRHRNSTIYYLEIYLCNTVYAQAGKPDYRILISSLSNYKKIEGQIAQLSGKSEDSQPVK